MKDISSHRSAACKQSQKEEQSRGCGQRLSQLGPGGREILLPRPETEVTKCPGSDHEVGRVHSLEPPIERPESALQAAVKA